MSVSSRQVWLAGIGTISAILLSVGLYFWKMKLAGVENVIVNGVLTLHQPQKTSRRLLKQRGLTLWENTRWKDVYDTNDANEIGESLSIEYGTLGMSNAIWGSAQALTFDKQGTIYPGDSIERISQVLGPPRGRLKQASRTLLVYGQDRLVIVLGADGYSWFHLSDHPIDLLAI